ncbi:MAG: arsenite efflux transporter metallochaperone ArsD [Gemmatimonadales bacterium]
MPNPSLPIADSPLDQALRGTVAVYDPPMCCSTGLCGPGVDPVLLQLTRDLRWLESQGVAVQRLGISQEPQAFAQQAKVSGLMQAYGLRALPVVLVNGEVAVHGRYPTREELTAALAAGDADPVAPAGSPGGCAPGSGCC